MKKSFNVFLFLLIPQYAHEPWKIPTAKGYYYHDETKLPKQKILIFSYGSLVKQKDNKKTGDLLYAGEFSKTQIKVPVSFTFLAGYPLHMLNKKTTDIAHFPTRRATATIDSTSKDYKNLWVATSDFSYVPNARNNLAAREGAPLLNQKTGFDVSNIFYIKKVNKKYQVKKQEKKVPKFPEWVTLQPTHEHQQLSQDILQEMVTVLNNNNAEAALWVALPSNVDQQTLSTILENDPVFVKNTITYIQKLPSDNVLSDFEKKVLEKWEILLL